MIKISNTFYNIIVSVITVLLTTAILSFILIFINNKEKEYPVYVWLKTWKLVFILAYLISLFLPKLTKKLLSIIFITEKT